MSAAARRFWIVWAAGLGLCLLWNFANLMEWSSRRPQRYLGGMDENHYFAWARSPVVDGDIDFRNDFEYLATLPGGGATTVDFAAVMERYQGGVGPVQNKYGPGTGLLAMPLLATAHGMRRIYESASGVAVSDFASLYVLAYLANQILLGFAGMAGVFLLLRRTFSERRAALAVAVGFAGLPLGYYIWFNPAMSHAAGFAVGTAFVLATVRWTQAFGLAMEEGRFRRDAALWAAAMGALLGLEVLVRYPNGVFALLPALMGLAQWHWAGRKNGARFVGYALGFMAISAAAFGVAMIPQFLAWKALYGAPVVYSYQGESLGIAPVHALQVLAGTKNSLLLWSPVAAFGIAGLIVGVRRRDPLCVGALGVLGALLWVYGAWWAYTMGFSFGQRGFADVSQLLMVGFAWALQSRFAGRALKAAIAAAVAWNLWMVFAVRAEVQHPAARFAGTELLRQAPRIAAQPFAELRTFRALFRRRYPVFTPKDGVVDEESLPR